jgi:hypothetical protein
MRFLLILAKNDSLFPLLGLLHRPDKKLDSF